MQQAKHVKSTNGQQQINIKYISLYLPVHPLDFFPTRSFFSSDLKHSSTFRGEIFFELFSFLQSSKIFQ